MLEKHWQYTRSTLARFVLDDFENQTLNFIKVFPKDYKKVLQGAGERGVRGGERVRG
jgi:glutamate synthase (NADPH/NADH) large chain